MKKSILVVLVACAALLAGCGDHPERAKPATPPVVNSGTAGQAKAVGAPLVPVGRGRGIVPVPVTAPLAFPGSEIHVVSGPIGGRFAADVVIDRPGRDVVLVLSADQVGEWMVTARPGTGKVTVLCGGRIGQTVRSDGPLRVFSVRMPVSDRRKGPRFLSLVDFLGFVLSTDRVHSLAPPPVAGGTLVVDTVDYAAELETGWEPAAGVAVSDGGTTAVNVRVLPGDGGSTGGPSDGLAGGNVPASGMAEGWTAGGVADYVDDILGNGPSGFGPAGTVDGSVPEGETGFAGEGSDTDAVSAVEQGGGILALSDTPDTALVPVDDEAVPAEAVGGDIPESGPDDSGGSGEDAGGDVLGGGQTGDGFVTAGETGSLPTPSDDGADDDADNHDGNGNTGYIDDGGDSGGMADDGVDGDGPAQGGTDQAGTPDVDEDPVSAGQDDVGQDAVGQETGQGGQDGGVLDATGQEGGAGPGGEDVDGGGTAGSTGGSSEGSFDGTAGGQDGAGSSWSSASDDAGDDTVSDYVDDILFGDDGASGGTSGGADLTDDGDGAVVTGENDSGGGDDGDEPAVSLTPPAATKPVVSIVSYGDGQGETVSCDRGETGSRCLGGD